MDVLGYVDKVSQSMIYWDYGKQFSLMIPLKGLIIIKGFESLGHEKTEMQCAKVCRLHIKIYITYLSVCLAGQK